MAILLVAFLGGLVCAIVASGKRRNAVGWFVIGFLLPLIGVILVLVLPPGSGGIDSDTALMAAAPMQPVAAPHQASIDALERLASLRDRGALTTEEFEAKKQELLRAQSTPAGTIACPKCGRQVEKSLTVMTGDGVICDRCHAAA
jgi:hypothetical protein